MSRERAIERVLDACVGLTALHLAALAATSQLPLGVRVATAAIDVVVALLFFVRVSARTHGSSAEIAVALPSIALGGAAYALAPSSWPLALVLVHGAFAMWVLFSLTSIGRSFALLPARRAITSRGPYAIVRHPIYLGELGMVATACASRGVLWAIAGLLLSLVLVLPRSLAEEHLLAADAAYEAYRSRVRWRLLPGLF